MTWGLVFIVDSNTSLGVFRISLSYHFYPSFERSWSPLLETKFLRECCQEVLYSDLPLFRQSSASYCTTLLANRHVGGVEHGKKQYLLDHRKISFVYHA